MKIRVMRDILKAVLFAAVVALGGASKAAAQGAEGGEKAGGGGGQSLASKATDPTAGLMSFTFAEVWTADYWDLDRQGYAFRFRPALPFQLWGVPNILRVSLQFDHGGLPGYGLADVQVFDLIIMPAGKGRIAIGPLFNLSAATSRTPSPFGVGPAIGYVHADEKMTYGVFSQNVFGDGFGTTSLQPVFTAHLGRTFDISPGDLQFTYDWEGEEWISLPVGVQLGHLALVAKQAIRTYASYQYNFRDLPGLPRNVAQAGLVLLLP